jgi:hypothetical protein
MQSDANKSNRNKLLLVLALFAVPFAISYFLYYVKPPQGGITNYGELIPPVTLADDASLSDLDGKLVPLKSLRGKWLLVHADAGACDALCEKHLYGLRQVRLIQGKEQDRVERVWLLTDDAAPRTALTQAPYDGMRILRDPNGALLPRLPAKQNVSRHIYIIDPLGNVMMRYDADPDLKRMGKDLGKLLRASQIG